MRVQDGTGTVSFVLFDKDVSKIVGRSAYDIREQQVKVFFYFSNSESIYILILIFLGYGIY